MSLRDTISDSYKTAMRERDQKAVSAVRLIMSALKDKDIAARPKGLDKIPDEEILSMLQGMVKQRRESIEMYSKGNRPDLAETEQGEIEVIERFLPRQMDEAEMTAAIAGVIARIGAQGIKDMGKVMAELKTAYAGSMDFSKAGPLVKQSLS